MSSFELPIWVEYAKALGAPVVALLAAFIAGSIAYRQWVTARNKLKLDLFDRRMKIYSSAFETIKWMAEGDRNDRTAVWALANSSAEARWLLDITVSEYLADLFKRANSIGPLPKIDYASMTREEKIAQVRKEIGVAAVLFQNELGMLDALFESYLCIRD